MEPSHFGIKIKTLDNSLHELDISPEMTVTNLKTLIEDVLKIFGNSLFLLKENENSSSQTAFDISRQAFN